MSRSSFPRTEHIAALRVAIARGLGAQQVRLEVAERGIDHLRCCYRFGFRHSAEQDWIELPIHFQVAERLEAGRGTAELERILDSFLKCFFAAAMPAPSPRQEQC